jgi:cytochrome c peroxidase
MDWKCGRGWQGSLTDPQRPISSGRKRSIAELDRFKLQGLLSIPLIALLAGCGSSNHDRPIGTVVEIKAPLGLPSVPVPRDNPPTAETIALGRRLFYDVRLSRDESVSCASCHEEKAAFSDERAVSLGVGGLKGVRNAPTLLDSAYLPVQFWDGRAATLEQQTLVPVQDHREMAMSPARLLFRLNTDATYRAMAEKAYGTSMLNTVRVQKAIASFERTLLSGDSPFDRFYFGGDKSALTPAQVRGFLVFEDSGRGNCAVCHTISKNYATFTDGKFHNLGIGVRDDESLADIGRFGQTGTSADTGAFLTPTLRNVGLTAPYMHDGSEKTLDQVIDYYAGHGNSNPYIDPEMAKIHLSGQEKSDLVEFLKSLTGTMPEHAGPPAKE